MLCMYVVYAQFLYFVVISTQNIHFPLCYSTEKAWVSAKEESV